MVVSSRAVAALGIGLVGLGLMTGPASGQQAQDGTVRRAATQAAAPAPANQAPVPTVIGTVDIEAVFKSYDKVKTQQEEFKAAAMAKHNELMKFQTEGQEEAQKLSKLTPSSLDAKKAEDRITQLKAQLEAGREQAQRDFALRESEMLATLYKEVQEMVALIAKHKKMTYIVQVSNEPVAGSNPNSVMAAMAKTVVYADDRNDITKDVVFNLNKRYKAAGGVAPKASATAPSPAGNPAGN
ncbi:MAG: OmpH family outer membrane protein [Planctomycetia bacterium]|nr:OmpH family outer membrane protein [Planctomycetia bacterium]